jgi:SpoIID/LytB domain protein
MIKKSKNQHLGLLLAASCLLGLTFAPGVKAKDIELKVGVVQRFGEKTTDKLVITSPSGGNLTLKFQDGNNQPTSLQTNSVSLEIVKQPLNPPRPEARLVLSDHATFETAEDSAKEWERRGIAVEITQPGRWQVWAKRDIYKNPLLKRLLFQSIQKQGHNNPYLQTVLLSEKATVSFVVNGNRYHRDYLDIISSNNQISVQQPVANPPSRTYGGSLRIQPNSYGNFTLVNQVPLETYLRGVVPHEIGHNAPRNAAEAQTIIARTYALRNLRRFKADNYELCADTHCQVYYGLSGTNATADQIIQATKGLVLTYQNELVDALYSSTTGGITASFEDIWNGEDRPYLRPVIDAPNQIWDLSQKSLANEETFRQFIALQDGFNETGRSVFRWNKQSSLEELSADLQKYLQRTKHPLADFTKISQMKITKRSPSGRILEMAVQTDRGTVNLYKTEVRSAFGPPRSTLFYIEPVFGADQSLKAYTFIGGGFGHGVGLSQYGSYNLAKLGWSSQQILSFYYPGTTIKPLDNTIVFWRGQ